MNLEIVGHMIGSAMRVLYMAEREDFDRIFGDSAAHLWGKWCNQYHRNEGEFICSLDLKRLTALATAALEETLKSFDQEKALNDAVEQLAKKTPNESM